MSEDRRYRILHWDATEARIKAFSSASRGKATTIKIEMEVTDPDCLGSIMRELQEASKPYRPPPPPKAEQPRALPAPRRAFPAPMLQLEDRTAR